MTSAATSASPGANPQLTPSQAEALAHEHYGLTGTATDLPSERDRNFRLDCGAAGTFVLKVFNAAEDEEFVEAQRRVFEVLGGASGRTPAEAATGTATGTRLSVFPTLVPTTGRAAYSHAVIGETSHALWLMSWLPGRRVAEVSELTRPLLHDIGTVLGGLDTVLARNPQAAARRTFVWAPQTAPDVIAGNLRLLRGEQRELVAGALRDFDARVRPRLGALRVSLIHNDVNDYNLLVEGDRVTAVLDFGDMLEAYTVCDLAHLLAYLLLDRDDPLAIAAGVAAGYQSVFPLTSVELESLYDFVRLRLALSVTLSALQQSARPDDPYLSISEEPAWRLLARLADEPLRARFQAAVLTVAGA
jgi:Ser/Thr protein kinase RdoA (MazF antagonist)